ncbi:MAG: SH3 domain-containing protein, partial [Clostridia bacterium]|nr:SH3 domain-containing protein [Clostridia bacterium]
DPTLNLRDKVGAGSVVLTEIPNGATVTVLQCTDGWAKVTYNEYTGWVSANYLKPYKNVDQ